ncbi:hypothetical protein KP509_29G083200 [Ceratopteris richardii]|nr:hypothetical protein KP509_29G083200 [Ceratopteris richardii]
MFFKISSILKESPRILRQYYCLAGDEDQNNDAVPDIRMFDPSAPNDEIDMHGDIVFDEKRIIHIMNVNSFSGGVKVSRKDPEMRLTGLWLLPSFLNHSCIPNASRLIVGETMFIIASRSIKPQEEITISYTDAMSPLKKREKNLSETGYGFLCRCKRCMLERSVHHEIEKFSDRYDMLYDKAAAEVYAAVTNTITPTLGSFPSCSELSALYHTLNQKVRFLKGLSRLEQQWIMGGYSCAFLGNWLLIGYATQFTPASNFVNSTALELIKAMKATESGLQRTLSFATLLTMVAEKERGKFSSLTEGLLNFALDECIRIYGKQRLDVSVSLIEQSAEIVPFF